MNASSSATGAGRFSADCRPARVKSLIRTVPDFPIPAFAFAM